jgi:TonB family protein
MNTKKTVTRVLLACAVIFALPIILACSKTDSEVDAKDPCGGSVVLDRDLDIPPKKLKSLAPEYPYDARKESWEGIVKIRLTISSDGTICDTTILTGSGRSDADSSVLKATAQWVYEPGVKDGDPVKTEVVTTVRFALDG